MNTQIFKNIDSTFAEFAQRKIDLIENIKKGKITQATFPTDSGCNFDFSSQDIQNKNICVDCRNTHRISGTENVETKEQKGEKIIRFTIECGNKKGQKMQIIRGKKSVQFIKFKHPEDKPNILELSADPFTAKILASWFYEYNIKNYLNLNEKLIQSVLAVYYCKGSSTILLQMPDMPTLKTFGDWHCEITQSQKKDCALSFFKQMYVLLHTLYLCEWNLIQFSDDTFEQLFCVNYTPVSFLYEDEFPIKSDFQICVYMLKDTRISLASDKITVLIPETLERLRLNRISPLYNPELNKLTVEERHKIFKNDQIQLSPRYNKNKNYIHITNESFQYMLETRAHIERDIEYSSLLEFYFVIYHLLKYEYVAEMLKNNQECKNFIEKIFFPSKENLENLIEQAKGLNFQQFIVYPDRQLHVEPWQIMLNYIF